MPQLPAKSPLSLHPTFVEPLSQDLDIFQLSHLPFLSPVHPLELTLYNLTAPVSLLNDYYYYYYYYCYKPISKFT